MLPIEMGRENNRKFQIHSNYFQAEKLRKYDMLTCTISKVLFWFGFQLFGGVVVVGFCLDFFPT